MCVLEGGVPQYPKPGDGALQETLSLKWAPTVVFGRGLSVRVSDSPIKSDRRGDIEAGEGTLRLEREH